MMNKVGNIIVMEVKEGGYFVPQLADLMKIKDQVYKIDDVCSSDSPKEQIAVYRNLIREEYKSYKLYNPTTLGGLKISKDFSKILKQERYEEYKRYKAMYDGLIKEEQRKQKLLCSGC